MFLSSPGVTAGIGLVSLALLAGCAAFPVGGPDSSNSAESSAPTVAPPDAGGVPYVTSFEGAPEAAGLEDLMQQASHLIALQDKPPASMVGLRRRADEDSKRLNDVLRSRGFYAGSVTPQIEAGDPATVTLHVAPGEAYRLGRFEFEFQGTPPLPGAVPDIKDLGITLGMTAEAVPVVDAERALVAHFSEHGHPDAQVIDRQVSVDHETRLMTVRLIVDTGPRVCFGPLRFNGLKTVQKSYLRKLVPWKPGQLYQASLLESYRRTLRESGLFATVSAKVAAQEGANGQAPVVLTLEEAAHRSIGAGLAYATAEGPSAKAFWEHRNYWGNGETLRLTSSGGLIEQALELSYRKPSFLLRRQDFLALATVSRQDTDAYNRIGGGLRAGLERRSGNHWKSGVFGTMELSQVEDNEGRHLSKLFGLPIQLEWDNTDDLLDPTRGSRFGLYGTPYVGHTDNLQMFGLLEGRGSVYQALDNEGDFVLAGRLRLGSIFGEARKDIPADKRFYAGGGGSIRGYEYQMVGPLDAEGKPEGGLSVFEMGVEFRIKLTEDFGLVPFIDGGVADGSLLPSLSGRLQWAGGLGLRYHTPIGPLRFDVALPINGRRDIDERFQFYISIGQAF
ncbi:autotransporter assembly complex family protein [Magnetospira thiophila]